MPRIKDDETRRAVIRAYNIVSAEYFRGLEDRLTPAAIIPMHTPEEAIDELEFVTRQLGLKVGMFGSSMRAAGGAAQVRIQASKPCGTTCSASTARTTTIRYGRSASKSKMAPTFHSAGNGLGLRNSPSNFVYNHIGHFAAAGHAVAKGIFLGGVTRRFPELHFAFLEGGVGWGCQLFGDLIEHWERSGAPALKRMDPDKLDRKLLLKLVEEHGYDDIADGAERARRLARSRRHAADRQPHRTRRLCAVQDHPQGGLGRSVSPSRTISAARPTTA